MYIFLSEVYLEEKKYKSYLRITSECFDELFVFAEDNIAKQTTNIRDSSTPKPNLAAETFHVHSFIFLFS